VSDIQAAGHRHTLVAWTVGVERQQTGMISLDDG
jgi:hypothetical protein